MPMMTCADFEKVDIRAGLLGRLVLAVINLPPKQVGPFLSEVLTLGVPDGQGDTVLVIPERDVPLGGRLF